MKLAVALGATETTVVDLETGETWSRDVLIVCGHCKQVAAVLEVSPPSPGQESVGDRARLIVESVR